MSYRVIPAILFSFAVVGCTAQTQVTQPGIATSPQDVKVESASGVAATPAVTPAPAQVEQVVVQSDSGSISNQLDQLNGRLTLVQEQVINQRAQSEQQLELSQAILQRLQLLTQSTLLQDQTGQAQQTTDPAGTQQLDAAIGQLMQIANEMQVSAGPSVVPDWEIASAVTSKGWVLIRYKPKTGESWLAENGGWSALTDASAVTPGMYQLYLERRDTDSKGYVAVRINKNSGDTWWLNDRSWQAY